MLRIVHFADLHLGVEAYGRINPDTGLSSRLDDFLTGLDELVDFAISRKVDLVIFSGDAYKNRDPSQTYQREFALRIRKLAANSIQVFLLAGNHDVPHAFGRATSVEIFDALAVQNVTVAGSAEVHCLDTRKGPVQIVALPWVRRGKLLTRDDAKNLSSDKINEKIQEILTSWVTAQGESLDRNKPAILAGHLWHSEAIPGSEKGMMMGRDYVLLLSSIAHPSFDYVALGHVHKRQVINRPMPVVYPGSLQAIDFGDEGEDKGFYFLELDEKAPPGGRVSSCEFQPVRTRRFVTVKIDADCDDPAGEATRAISESPIRDAIVRLQIRVPPSKEAQIKDSDLRHAMRDAHHIASITREVDRERRSRLVDITENTMPLKALAQYLELRRTPKDRESLILSYGERLIQELTSE